MLCSPGCNHLPSRFRALQPKPRCLLRASSYPAVTEKQVIFHLPSSKTHTEQLPSNSQRAANLKLFHSHPLSGRRFAGCVSEIWTSLDPEDATSQYKDGSQRKALLPACWAPLSKRGLGMKDLKSNSSEFTFPASLPVCV